MNANIRGLALSIFLICELVSGARLYGQHPPAKPASLPTVDEVLARSVLATGGKEAWLKLTSMHMKDSVTTDKPGIAGTMEIYAEAPNKESDCLRLKMGIFFCKAYDGKSGWSDSSPEGLKDLQGKELEDIQRSAVFYSELERKKEYKELRVTGETDFDGLQVYVLEGLRKDGKRQELYFAKDSGFHAGTKDLSEIESEIKTTYFEDYKEIAGPGLKIPTKARYVSRDLTMRMVMEEIEPNAKIPPGIFVKPPKSARDPANSDVKGTPENAKIKGEVYENAFFPFQFTIPHGWTIHGEATEKVLDDAGKNLLAGDDAEKKNYINAATKRSHNLLTAFEFPLGTPGKDNPGIRVIAENVSYAPGIKTGEDYILGMKDVLGRSQLQVKYNGTPTEEKIDGVSFYHQAIENAIGNLTVSEIVYSTVLKGYAVTFVFTALSKDKVEEVAKSMKSFRITILPMDKQ